MKYEFCKTPGGMFWLYHGGREEEHVIEVARVKSNDDIRQILSEYIDHPAWIESKDQDSEPLGTWFYAFQRLALNPGEKILTKRQFEKRLDELEEIWKASPSMMGGRSYRQ